MQQPYQIATAQTEQQTTLAQQSRVLRNTYLLLAISMLPTIAGAMLGVGIAFRFFILNPIISLVAFMAIAFAFMWAIERTKNSVLGVVLLLAFTFFMGMMLSPLLLFTLGLGNGPQLIATAAGGTGVIFFTMASIATVTKKDFSFMGKFLIVGVLVTLVAMVANLFLHIPALYLAISAVCIVLFSMYILYDISRVIHGGETNYITATLAIYLDIYNIFVHLLRLLIALSGRD
ncbi:MAG: Bax inhibitor-1/YccA family protein [Candidatus Accumulibacter sp.]|jgi:modulator of FtsH protease|nr:Bax inhibitor-1/YccA family protein [Accumulibacter sp.]